MGWAVNCMKDYLIEEYKKHPPASFNEFDGLVNDAKQNYREVSKEAMDIGSEVHSAIEHHLITGEEPENPREEVLSAFLAFLEWKDANDMKVIKVEHSVYSLSPPYAGTLDLVCMLEGVKTYIDFKSSKAIYEPYRYQIAAYRQTDDFPLDCGSGILRLDKETGLPEYKDLSNKYENDIDIFNYLCILWWKRHPKKRKEFEEKGGVI